MFKKFLAGILVVLLVTAKFGFGLAIANQGEKDSLYQFLKDNDGKEVVVKYNYPSVKLAAVSTKTDQQTIIPAGTPIVIRTTETINANTVTSGSVVNGVVVSDVIVNDKIVIKANTIVSAQVSYIKKENLAGIPGEIMISDFTTKAVDGTLVPLKATINAKGSDKYLLSIGLGLFICILFLLIKGEEAIIPAGSTKSIYTMYDVRVNTQTL